MFSNAKLLVLISITVIILGIILLIFGLNQNQGMDNLAFSPEPTITSSPMASTASSSAVMAIEGEKALVTKVIDGDTIQVNNNQTVRFIGIDTPETVDPRRPIGCFGKEASNETKSLLMGKEVILQKDISDTDKYGRLLRLVFLTLDNNQVLFVNDYLVRAGFATAYTYPPDVKYNEQFRQAEVEAKTHQKGLWGKCN